MLDFQGVLNGQAIFLLREAWAYEGIVYGQGHVVAYGLKDGSVEVVMPAELNQSIESIGIGKSNIVIQYLEDVSGKAARLTRGKGGKWKAKEIKMPVNGVVEILSAGVWYG